MRLLILLLKSRSLGEELSILPLAFLTASCVLLFLISKKRSVKAAGFFRTGLPPRRSRWREKPWTPRTFLANVASSCQMILAIVSSIASSVLFVSLEFARMWSRVLLAASLTATL